MNLNRGNVRELFRNSLLRSRPPLTSRRQEPEVSQVNRKHALKLAPQGREERMRRDCWQSSSESDLHLLLCELSWHHRGHPGFLSYMKAGTGQSMRRGSKTIPHEGQHVVRGLCQTKETVLPLRDTKSHCPCLFFSSSKTVRVQNSLRR